MKLKKVVSWPLLSMLLVLLVVGGNLYAHDGQEIDENSPLSLGPALYFPTANSVYVWWHTAKKVNEISEFFIKSNEFNEYQEHLAYIEYGIDPHLVISKKVTALANPMNIVHYYLGNCFFTQLKGLVPSTTYYYRIVINNKKSKINSFTTLEDPNLFNSKLRIGIFGDNQRAALTFRKYTLKMLTEYSPQVLLTLGDVVQNGGKYRQWGRHLYRPAKEVLSQIPLLPVRGNHDGESELAHLMYPFVNNESWYSFHWGPLHLVVLDTNDDYTPGSKQYQWALREFSRPEWIYAKYRIVAFHHLPYTNVWSSSRYNGEEAVRKWIVPLIENAGANLVLASHAHCYSHGIRNFESLSWHAHAIINKIHYLTIGGGGGKIDKVERDNWAHILKSESINHIGILEVTRDSLIIKIINSKTGELVDQIII